MFASMAVLALVSTIYLRLCNRTTVCTRLYTSGAIDFDLRQAQTGATNLYEQPNTLVRHALRVHEEEEQHV